MPRACATMALEIVFDKKTSQSTLKTKTLYRGCMSDFVEIFFILVLTGILIITPSYYLYRYTTDSCETVRNELSSCVKKVSSLNGEEKEHMGLVCKDFFEKSKSCVSK